MFTRTQHPSGVELFEFICGECNIYMCHLCADSLLAAADVHKRVMHSKRLHVVPRCFRDHYLRHAHDNDFSNN